MKDVSAMEVIHMRERLPTTYLMMEPVLTGALTTKHSSSPEGKIIENEASNRSGYRTKSNENRSRVIVISKFAVC